jgi:putative membrane protein
VSTASALGLVAGLAGLIAILLWQGLPEIVAALQTACGGLLVVAAYHLVPMTLDAVGWRALLAPRERPSLGAVVRARWIGEAVNALLPVMQVGGAVARARLLAQDGVPAATAEASVVVDVTLVVGTQVLFTFLGLAVLVVWVGGSGVGGAAAVGAVVMAAAVAGFVTVQRRGMFQRVVGGVPRLGGRTGLAERAGAVDAAVAALYATPRRLAVPAAWHMASWLLGAGEIWLALRFLDHPVGVLPALLLESLGQAVRAAAFVVPAGLGVQEGTFLLLGHALGLPPDTAVALSLSKRVRDVCLGIPGLVVWQATTLRRLRAGRVSRSARRS